MLADQLNLIRKNTSTIDAKLALSHTHDALVKKVPTPTPVTFY